MSFFFWHTLYIPFLIILFNSRCNIWQMTCYATLWLTVDVIYDSADTADEEQKHYCIIHRISGDSLSKLIQHDVCLSTHSISL